MKKRTICASLILALLLSLLPVLPQTAEAAATTDMRENFVNLALTQVGYQEKKTDWTKYGNWYGNGYDQQPWCAMFVSWCANMSGVPESVLPKFAWCQAEVDWFRTNGTWKSRSYTPKAGDIVFYDWASSSTGKRDGQSDHVGIVLSADENYIYTVEGNTSGSSGSSTGEVALKTRARNYDIMGYGVPNYGAVSGYSCDISLSNLVYPKEMWKGVAFNVSGTVSSSYPITWLYADIRNESGKYYSYGYCNPGTASANISALSASLKFSALSTGNYYLYIEAVDSQYNFKTWKIPFVVYKSGYEIYYNAQGGTPTPESQKKPSDASITLSTVVPKKDDYIFLGWSTNMHATTAEYAPGAVYSQNSNATLYAVWKYCNHNYGENGVCNICGQSMFKDVYAYGWHKPFANAIYWAAENGITFGYPDRTFKPDIACTRAQTATFLWRAVGSPEPESTESPFEDVKNSGGMASYYKAILWAAENGVIEGYEDGTFRPDTVCSRAQFVTLLWRLVGSPTPTIENPFTDLDDNGYYEAILWAYETGVAAGYDDGTFLPYNDCTRAHIVTFIYRHFAE